ncbi:sigma-70 family RNA polymerase sigma factor [Amycolatopsis tolypomycina]|uniref:RNA polymerase sigma-70 factor, ECF subfamily n=1 Tax=Amycolatopsis tolypomycina TaxID=208445 RepID=A0A1H4IJX8_9PSEU|nr:sigma-70 family RNA polymerase sigma factor [Amycolatopsis tolypomycina]SEB33618.1 RNA polymerase sigma-70 factor, ECF subfamily [Amycolatopsis tolypomycina]
MDDLAARFEAERGRLRGLAYRMLGSAAEADDAVQEAWLRLNRVDSVGNLAAWLTTVVSRVCLDVLRSRKARREEPFEAVPEPVSDADPAGEAALADSVGRALLVVLDALGPAERIAFVLHDLFAVPFDRIAPVLDRTPVAAKKLASRARQRVRGTTPLPPADLARHRRVVDAFLAAARGGDLESLLDVLAPDVVRRADAAALPAGVALETRGARAVAEETQVFGKRARFAEAALLDGAVGVVVAPHGRLVLALAVTVEGERVAAYEVIADPARLAALHVRLLHSNR